jgi:hypothetical protein
LSGRELPQKIKKEGEDMKITKIYSKKEFIKELKGSCKELKECGFKETGKIVFYFQTCLTYKSASKKLMDYPL